MLLFTSLSSCELWIVRFFRDLSEFSKKKKSRNLRRRIGSCVYLLPFFRLHPLRRRSLSHAQEEDVYDLVSNPSTKLGHMERPHCKRSMKMVLNTSRMSDSHKPV